MNQIILCPHCNKPVLKVEWVRDNSPSQQTSVDKREVGTIIKETSDAGVNPVSDTNEEKIKSEPTVAELHKRELYKGIRAVNPQDGGQHGN